MLKSFCHEFDILGVIEGVKFRSLGAKAGEREDDDGKFHEVGVRPGAFGVCVGEGDGNIFCDPIV